MSTVLASPPRLAHQRGVVMFIALIVMVALSLAGVALVRSVDTTTAVVGNLAFRQAAMLPANLAVEEATAALFAKEARSGSALITDKTADMRAQNYYASIQPGEKDGVPADLLTKNAASGLARMLYAGNDTSFRVTYVIERTCRNPGPATPAQCDMMPPKGGNASTSNEDNVGDVNRLLFYRLTVRVDGPKNTTAFLQAMLR